MRLFVAALRSSKKRERAAGLLRPLEFFLFIGLCLLPVSCGDQVTNHKILSTLFDGVPALPPPGQICEDYYQARRAAELNKSAPDADLAATAKGKRSSHQPFAEKECSNCHDINNKVNEGFIVAKQDLCLVCHENFQGQHVHGPVAVGDCQACHLPHSSAHESLLIAAPEDICQTCHAEGRLAADMHDRFVVSLITCNQCHDPHVGNARYFLK